MPNRVAEQQNRPHLFNCVLSCELDRLRSSLLHAMACQNLIGMMKKCCCSFACCDEADKGNKKSGRRKGSKGIVTYKQAEKYASVNGGGYIRQRCFPVVNQDNGLQRASVAISKKDLHEFATKQYQPFLGGQKSALHWSLLSKAVELGLPLLDGDEEYMRQDMVLEYICCPDVGALLNTPVDGDKVIGWMASSCTFKPGFFKYDDGGAFVIFANKYLGGGVAHGALVQEEVAFVQFLDPLLLVARATDFNHEMNEKYCMAKNEVILISEIRKVVDTGNMYRYVKSEEELEQVVACENTSPCTFIEIDATSLATGCTYNRDQLEHNFIKALLGFQAASAEPGSIRTGEWGCGAFNNNFTLMCLIQVCLP